MRVLDCYLPVFTLVTRFEHQTEDFSDYDDFHQQCIRVLEQAVQDAGQLKLSGRERDDALFAVVVWLDERILCSAHPESSRWRTSLMQLRYFQTTVGGNEFFNRLNKLEDVHQQVRNVYLFCLQRGFHGKYGTQDADELATVIEQQRQRCLPKSWQAWPNNEAITPITIPQRRSPLLERHRMAWALLTITLFYGFLLLVQTLYFL
ncbi:DotU family type IV/VI secretion system protein [Serratia sp. JSRIV001]|uniref:DotU family type IV/VI secretion system protein n=1 Tax=Serratia TaxID=613 RepID=UPI000465F80E|nr:MULTISPECIES: DotU family type IV/VI secretion system protein [Serratia]UAN45157.1 DotU family type IV/VI secretion system protein [Serratia sp. JSRIV001]UAN50664.1 DotU family type IV/VI secretion system protein [Serratia sp. JSRIV002]UAN56621.1 DotU family type IV/VI secretion system protein [Serratia sp. JSRIV004]UAN62228.1 DotU family type IV/VI secretion system protein [Serratia sp. JSRIV006]